MKKGLIEVLAYFVLFKRFAINLKNLHSAQQALQSEFLNRMNTHHTLTTLILINHAIIHIIQMIFKKNFNASQLVKMKTSIPYMSLP